jgi:hypothetical protein
MAYYIGIEKRQQNFNKSSSRSSKFCEIAIAKLFCLFASLVASLALLCLISAYIYETNHSRSAINADIEVISLKDTFTPGRKVRDDG